MTRVLPFPNLMTARIYRVSLISSIRLAQMPRKGLFPGLIKSDCIFSHEGRAPDKRRRPLGRERNTLRLFNKADFNMLGDLEAVLTSERETERNDQCRV